MIDKNRFFLIINAVINRGIGSIIYVISVYYFLPSEIVSRDIEVLIISEFLLGILIYIYRVKSLNSKEFEKYSFILSIFIGILVMIFSIIILKHSFGFVYAILSVFVFPFLLIYYSEAEKKDLNKLIKLESKIALISSIIASVLLIIGYYIDNKNEYVSPALKIITSNLILLIVLVNNYKIEFKKYHYTFKINFLLRSMLEIDYVMVVSYFKMNLFKVLDYDLNIFNNSISITKIILMVYDPIAAFFGYYLRLKFSDVGFKTREYIKLTTFIFDILWYILLILLTIYLIDINKNLNNILNVMIAVLTLIILSAKTNFMTLACYKVKLIYDLIILAAALILIYGDEKISYAFLICSILLIKKIYLERNKYLVE